MILLDRMVHEVHKAYREGRSRESSGYQEYEFQVQTVVQQWGSSFLPQERTTRDIFSELLRATIKKTREGDLSGADSLISTIQGILHQNTLSSDSACVCTSFLKAAIAYLDYKRQQCDLAIVHLQEALAIDEQVEQRNPNFVFLHLHRIMLLDNWIRVLARQQQQREAITLAFHVLDYLEGKAPSLPLPTSWDSSCLGIYPEGVLSVLFRTITTEIAVVVTGKQSIICQGESLDIQEVFDQSRHWQQYDTAKKCLLSQASHDWICMKQAALEKNIVAFLHYALPLLSAGPVPKARPTFWNAAVVEFMLLSYHMPECKSDILNTFRAEIVQDVSSSPQFPPAWKTIVTETEQVKR